MGIRRSEAVRVATDFQESGQPLVESKPLPVIAADRVIETSHGRIALSQTAGPGLPLLFLHGNAASKDVFFAQFHSPLAQAHRLIAIDLPGHGDSSDATDPSATYSIPGYADAAIEVLEALDIDQVAVIGWSLGGHIALEMMTSFPGLVGAFITSAPPLGLGVDALRSAFSPAGLEALTHGGGRPTRLG